MLQNVTTRGTMTALLDAEVHDLGAVRSDRHRHLLAEARDEMVGGDEEMALDSCLEAIKYHRSYEALSLAGTLFSILGEREESLRYTREAIEVSPRRADAYYDLASTLLDMGRPDQALPWLERGVRLLGRRNDDLVDFMCAARVEALAELGRMEDAETALADAKERSEDSLHLIEEAEDLLEDRRRRPRLRLV